MKNPFSGAKKYIEGLRERKQDSRVHHDHQFVGLELANMLKDIKRRSLYIKLAKEYGGQRLLALAKSVLERKDVKNPAAYFMTMLQELKKDESRQ